MKKKCYFEMNGFLVPISGELKPRTFALWVSQILFTKLKKKRKVEYAGCLTISIIENRTKEQGSNSSQVCWIY